MLGTMSPSCWKLFGYALDFVTPKNVANFCPNDPGYPGYVRVFTAILKTKKLPASTNFEISETIGLTRWANAEEERNPDEFRRFRVFTNAIAVSLHLADEGPDDIPPNYTCACLLDDAYALKDAELIRLLLAVFIDMHRSIEDESWWSNEVAFITLGQLMIALLGHASDADTNALCERLLSEEAACKENTSGKFLWGCTTFGQLNDRWKALVDLAFPKASDNESLLLLRAMLLA